MVVSLVCHDDSDQPNLTSTIDEVQPFSDVAQQKCLPPALRRAQNVVLR